MPTIHSVVDSYAEYLLSKHKPLARRFLQTQHDRPESALAEAAVFGLLQQCGVKPQVADLVNIGGPDFRCTGYEEEQFMVEATSFEPDKVTRHTGIENSVAPGISGQAFSLLTRQIDEKAAQKKRQFDQLGVPGILAIASSHLASGLVLDAYAASNALISQSFWVVGEDQMFTDLASSVFLRLEDDGEIAAKNQSISAVLLVSVGHSEICACGALNPAASHPFRSQSLWMIPFAYLKDWPVQEGKLRCEWTMGSTRTYVVKHKSIRLS